MAKHGTQNVGTTATKLNLGGRSHQSFEDDNRGRTVTLKPAAAISIGGPGVTVAAGIDIAANAIVTLTVSGDLYAIGASATTVKVLMS